MATYLGDLMHPSGKYIKDGEEKTSWLKVGALFQNEQGKYRIKMDAFPSDCSETGGWLSVFEPRQQQQAPAPQQQQGFRRPAPADDLRDDDVPFNREVA